MFVFAYSRNCWRKITKITTCDAFSLSFIQQKAKLVSKVVKQRDHFCVIKLALLAGVPENGPPTRGAGRRRGKDKRCGKRKEGLLSTLQQQHTQCSNLHLLQQGEQLLQPQ
jgi:hypothetical protein